MSAAGAWLARAFASLGGPQTAVVVLVAGVVAGGLGGYAITNSQRAGTANPNGLAVYPCPNQGPALLTIAGGQQLLVTGRLADSSWLRIHLPEPGRNEGWVQAAPLTVKGSVDTLPVVTCAAEAGAASPAIAPLESMTAVLNATPSPGPTPTPTPVPSSTPNAGPALAGLAASAQTISYDPAAYCATAVKSVTVSVKASDAANVAGVVLFWRAPGASFYTQTAMTMTAGTAASGTWQATLSTAANGINHAGTLSYYAVATDSAGATSRVPPSGASAITVNVCSNAGPTITQVSSSSGSSLYWDPLGRSSCTTVTNITASVVDPNGVSAVTLYFRRPGNTSWVSRAMSGPAGAGIWNYYLDTLGDKVSIPTPPTGTLSWYIKATDGKGASSQTKTASTTIRRCDSPASIKVALAATSYPFSPPSNTFNLKWSGFISDPDGLTTATLTFTAVNTAGTKKVSGKVTGVLGRLDTFTSGPLYGPDFVNGGTVYWTITTKDVYGGTGPPSSGQSFFSAG